MKLGDVVNFYTGAWVFASANARYHNPGVIVEVNCSRRSRFAVLWADGRITNEHLSYLQKQGEEE